MWGYWPISGANSGKSGEMWPLSGALAAKSGEFRKNGKISRVYNNFLHTHTAGFFIIGA